MVGAGADISRHRRTPRGLLAAAFVLLELDQHRDDENQQYACYQPVHALPSRFALSVVDII
jgi:hypothetical protein